MSVKKQGSTGKLSPEIRYWGPGYEATQSQLDAGADPYALQQLGYPVDLDGGPDETVVQFQKKRVTDRPGPRVPNEPSEEPAPLPQEPLHLREPDVYEEIDEDGNPLDTSDLDDRLYHETGAEVIAIDADVAFAPNSLEKHLAQERHPSTFHPTEGS